MLVCRTVGGHQDDVQERDWCPVGGVELDRVLRVHEQLHRPRDAVDTSMWNRHAAAKRRGPGFLAAPECTEHRHCREAPRARDECGDRLQSLLPVAHVESQLNEVRGQCSCARFGHGHGHGGHSSRSHRLIREKPNAGRLSAASASARTP